MTTYLQDMTVSRQAFHLHMGGKTDNEIAQILNIGVNSIPHRIIAVENEMVEEAQAQTRMDANFQDLLDYQAESKRPHADPQPFDTFRLLSCYLVVILGLTALFQWTFHFTDDLFTLVTGLFVLVMGDSAVKSQSELNITHLVNRRHPEVVIRPISKVRWGVNIVVTAVMVFVIVGSVFSMVLR